MMFSTTIRMTYNATGWPVPAQQTPQDAAQDVAPPHLAAYRAQLTRSPYTVPYCARGRDGTLPPVRPTAFERGFRDVTLRVRNGDRANHVSEDVDYDAPLDAGDCASWVDDAFAIDREAEKAGHEAEEVRRARTALERAAEVAQQRIDDGTTGLDEAGDVDVMDVDGNKYEADVENVEGGKKAGAPVGQDAENEAQDDEDGEQMYEEVEDEEQSHNDQEENEGIFNEEDGEDEADVHEVDEDAIDGSNDEDLRQIQRARCSTTAQSRAHPASETPSSATTTGPSTQATKTTPVALLVTGQTFRWARGDTT
jgi:hypothetical protein